MPLGKDGAGLFRADALDPGMRVGRAQNLEVEHALHLDIGRVARLADHDVVSHRILQAGTAGVAGPVFLHRGHAMQGILDGVAAEFPALAQAQEFQDRAARVGFDWPDVTPVLAKVMEELEEVRTAGDEDHRAKELGDLLFAVVNYVRWHKVDSETTLRETNQRFRKRFAHIEERAREMGRELSSMTLAEMDIFWDEAKDLERDAKN